jgi:hypothetical protein
MGQFMKFIVAATTLALSVLVSACGGGGSDKDATCSDFSYQEDAQAAFRNGATQLDGDHDGIACENLPHRPAGAPPVVPSNASPAGLWKGSTSTSRTVNGLVFADGSYYILYSAVGNSTLLGGVVQGTGSTSGNSFASSNAKDFNVEGFGVTAATVAGTVVTRSSFGGTVAYPSKSALAFNSSYSSQFQVVPTLASLAGTYTGQVAFSAGLQSIALNVSTTGVISSVSNGCTLSGSATPRTDGNAYVLSIHFGPAPCFFSNQTLTGLAYYDAATKRVYVAAPNATRSDGVVFLGVKP